MGSKRTSKKPACANLICLKADPCTIHYSMHMATIDELREMAHEAYARARRTLDPLTKRRLFRQADDYLKQADELRRGDVVQAAFPKPDTFLKPDRIVG